MPTALAVDEPDDRKRRALELAAGTTRARDAAVAVQGSAFLAATDAGASLREIADATGIPHMTVRRIIERARASDPTLDETFELMHELERDLVSATEAARRLGVTTREVYRRIDAGSIKVRKVDRVVRIPVSELPPEHGHP